MSADNLKKAANVVGRKMFICNDCPNWQWADPDKKPCECGSTSYMEGLFLLPSEIARVDEALGRGTV